MSLECPVCLDLPEGEVHQCNEGHCYCAACWNRLEEPRRCPECRQPIPQANRNRTAERAIAALEWSCEHCGEATTRGAKAAHVSACPQRPTVCAASAAGCGWAGVAAGQVAHEAACPFAICQRMMAPLQAQNQQLQARCDGLEQQVAAVEPLQVRCDGLQAENRQLQQKVAALQPLVGQVRALEGVGTEEGGRRQRRRMGPAPHDAPPSDAAVAAMGLTEAVAALRAHVADARVAEQACDRLVCLPEGIEQAAAEAGAIEAVVEAMQAHRRVVGVQSSGCGALHSLCLGFDAAARARAQRAAGAGMMETVVAALWLDKSVQYLACMALTAVCIGNDAAGRALKQQASDAGALEAVIEAMRAHPQDEDLQASGCKLLLRVCGGIAISAEEHARRQRAEQAGGRTVAAAAMQAHPGNRDVQDQGQLVLDALSA